jgi:gliding motility-associated-like protein
MLIFWHFTGDRLLIWKVIALLIWILPLAGSISGQATFQKEIFPSLSQPVLGRSTDGRLLYLAGTASGAGGLRLTVLQFDGVGNMQWTRQYGGTFTQAVVNDLLPLPDGGVLLVMEETFSMSASAWLVRLDAQGNLLWNHSVGQKNFTRLFDMEEDGAGKIWASGLKLGQTPNDTSFYFMAQVGTDGRLEEGRKIQFRAHPTFVSDDFVKIHRLRWDQGGQKMWGIFDESALYVKKGNIANPVYGAYRGKNQILASFDAVNKFNHTTTQIEISDYLFTPEGNIWVSGMLLSQFVTNTTDKRPCLAFYNPKRGNFPIVIETSSPLTFLGLHAGQILAYSTGENALLCFDDKANIVWRKVIDRCLETLEFDGVVLSDGSIMSVRNLKSKTVLSKFSPDGTLNDCSTESNRATKWLTDVPHDSYIVENYYLFNRLNIPHQPDRAVGFPPDIQLKPFCSKADARFVLPDTVCLMDVLQPLAVDTLNTVEHVWYTPGQSFDDAIPTVLFGKKGRAKILHEAQTGSCRDTFSRSVQVQEVPDVRPVDTLVCGAPIFQQDIKGPPGTNYFLDGKPIAPPLRINASGTYNLIASAPGCSDTAQIQVEIVDFKSPFAPPPVPICAGDTATLVLSDFDKIVWDGQPFTGDTLRITDAARHRFQAVYRLQPACVLQGDLTIPRRNCRSGQGQNFFVPNVFSPNGDGQNDLLEIPQTKITVTNFQVFDRWGTLVYQSENNARPWDGQYRNRPSPPGIYVWKMHYEDILSGEKAVAAGEVLLVR